MLNQIAAIHGTGVAASTNSYESIATVTLGSSASSVEFTSIPSTYKHLQIRAIARNTNSLQRDIYVTFNSDTGANYSWHRLTGDGASASADAGTSQSYMILARASESTASYYGAMVLDVLDYTNTNKYTTARALAGIDRNGSGSVWLNSGSWRNTAAVSTITFKAQTTDSFAANTTFALYGIKG